MSTVPGSTAIPLVHPRKNIGTIVAAILAQPEKTRGGTYVLCHAKWTTLGGWLQMWADVQNEEGGKNGEKVEVQWVDTSFEAYKELWPGLAEEMDPMNRYYNFTGKGSYKPKVPGTQLLDYHDLRVSAEELGCIKDAAQEYVEQA
jgi:hypothetical protein